MAPRINAGGRLALASRGVQLLTTRRMDTAREIAEELNQDNIRRRELEIEIFQQADEMTRQQIDFMNERAIVVCGEGWNPGVIGWPPPDWLKNTNGRRSCFPEMGIFASVRLDLSPA